MSCVLLWLVFSFYDTPRDFSRSTTSQYCLLGKGAQRFAPHVNRVASLFAHCHIMNDALGRHCYMGD